MARILPISAVKARLPELVSGVDDREEEIVVTRKGPPGGRARKPCRVRAPERDRRRAERSVLMRQIRASRGFYAASRRGLSFEDVFGEPIIPTKRRRR